MKKIGSFTMEGVPMDAMLPDEGTETILCQPLWHFAMGVIAKTYPGLVLEGICLGGVDGEHGPMVPIQFLPRAAEQLGTNREWRMFLGSDGSGQVEVFVDTGGDLAEAAILTISADGWMPPAISGPCDLMVKLNRFAATQN